MTENQFSFTTRQAARLLNVEPHCLRDASRRTGRYKGVKPRRVGRALLWPRDIIFALAGTPETRPGLFADLRALRPLIESHGLPADDPAIEAFAVALVHPRIDSARPPQSHAEDACALADIIKAHVQRLSHDQRLSETESNDALLALARAIGSALVLLPPELIQQAQSEALAGMV